MKTLKTVQTLAKVGRILSKIVFICSLVGGIMCIVSLPFAFLPDSIKFGGVTLKSIIEDNSEISLGTCYASLFAGIFLCAGEAVLAKISEKFFAFELSVGTPFNAEVAKKLKNLGICTIFIPFGAVILANVVYKFAGLIFTNVADIESGDYMQLGLGIMMIICALLCKMGAEVSENKQ